MAIPPDIQAILTKAAKNQPLTTQERSRLQVQLTMTPRSDPNWEAMHYYATQAVDPATAATNPVDMTAGIGPAIPPGLDLGSGPGGVPQQGGVANAQPHQMSVFDQFTQGHWQPTRDFMTGGGHAPPSQGADPAGDMTGTDQTENAPAIGGVAASGNAGWEQYLKGGQGAQGDLLAAQGTGLAGAGLSAPTTPAGGFLDPSSYAGYSFMQVDPFQRQQFFSDPEGYKMEALNLAQQAGQGGSAAYYMSPYVNAALILAQAGVLGGPNTGSQFGGPASDEAKLKLVEDLMRSQGQGDVVDPAKLMRVILNKAEATPNVAPLDPTTNQPIGTSFQSGRPAGTTDVRDPNDEIQLTNKYMLAAAQWLVPDAQQGLQKMLDQTAIDYKNMLSKGQISMSYPKYLDSLHIVQMFGGQ